MTEYNEKAIKNATVNAATDCPNYAEELCRHFAEMNDRGWRLMTISASERHAVCFWERA